MKPFKTIEYKGYFININIDETPRDPRSYDNLGTMVCWHSRYVLGDKHDYSANHELLSDLAKMETLENYVGDIMKEVKKHAVLLKLFLYDHYSGIAISASPFDCKWNSSIVGYIYVTREKLKAEGLETKSDAEIEEMLKSEIKAYDQFITGEVYGFQIEDKNGNEIDSCWGFFGDFEKNGMLTECRETIDRTVNDNNKRHFKRLKQWIKSKVPLIYRKPLVL